MLALVMAFMTMLSGDGVLLRLYDVFEQFGLHFPVEVAGGDGQFTNVCSGCAASSTLVTDLYCRWA